MITCEAKRILTRSRRNIFQRFKRRLVYELNKRAHGRAWKRWLDAETVDLSRLNATAADEIATWPRQPVLSIILPVYNVDEIWLRKCISSVVEQIYPHWELCIADDNSPSPHIRRVLDEYAASDARIKLVYRAENGHISAASNSALALATGEFCILLDHDDELSPDALYWVAKEINDNPDAKMIYSDEDMIDNRGRRYDPKFKPDFSQDLLYSLNLVTHLSAYRTDNLNNLGGFRVGTEGSQDYDLALRFIEQIGESQIRHIPRILYHWRAIPGSVALSGDEKPYAHERARVAIREHFARTGVVADVEATPLNLHRVRYQLPVLPPRVSLIVPGKVDGSVTHCYPDIEVLEIEVATDAVAENFNDVVARSTGDLLCFLGPGLRPIYDDWLHDFAGFAMQAGIGAIGGKILDPGDHVCGSALIVGTDDAVSVAHQGLVSFLAGNNVRNLVTSNYSAVSVDCLMTRREVFDSVGGFDVGSFPNDLFDADYCLRLRERGLRVVHHPQSEFHSRSRKKLKSFDQFEFETFSERWRAYFDRDPFYNPNLSKKDGRFRIR